MPRRSLGGEGKRHPLNMRTTRELRDRIAAAAQASGRSLVQEVERRLEDSFLGNPLIDVLVGGGQNAELLRLIALALQVQSASGRSWKDNAQSAETVREAVGHIIAAVAGLPPTKPDPTSNMTSHQRLAHALMGTSSASPTPDDLAGRVLASIILQTAGLPGPIDSETIDKARQAITEEKSS